MSTVPKASSETARRTMQANRRTNTRPERLLRSELHRRGLRYRRDLRLKLAAQSVRPDIVFPRARVAVFVDGCFWHRCAAHATQPRTNREFWQAKLARNVARDRANDAALKAAGWTVLRVWEHEEVRGAADRVSAAVAARQQRQSSGST